jgi:Zn-dependent oligopeptidase
MGLTSNRFVDGTHSYRFYRAGAALIRNQEELADLRSLTLLPCRQVSTECLKDRRNVGHGCEKASDMTGCPESLVEAAQAAASELTA